MPKSDTWPGGVAMESLSNMDSAGSCDSVISMNSGYSEDSMEHLSAEERACLMYLEETIEALEVQEDSGLSNDEPDSVLQAEKMGRMSATDISSFTSESRSDLKPDKAELHALNQTLDLQSSPASTANMKDVKTSVNLMTQPKPPVTESATGCEIHPPATQSEVLCLSKDGDGNIKIISSNKLSHSQTSTAPEIDLGLIPPPSDFRDEPSPPPRPEKAKTRPPSGGISNSKPGATIDLEQLRQRASAKRTSVTSPVTQEPPNKPPELSPVAFSSVSQMSPPPESPEPRSPPAVAPKPKKLPVNIILKSHKAGAVAEGNSGLSVPPSSDRLLLDPQRVRLEALRKLGLLKSTEADTSPILSPKHSPKTRRSWAAPSSPVSPAAPHTPPMTPAPAADSPSGPTTAPAADSPSGPATAPVAVSPSGPATAAVAVSPSGPATAPVADSPSGPATAPVADSPSGPATAPADEPPDFIPAPPAFSDPDGPLSDDEPTAVKDLSEATANAWANTPPQTPPSLVKQLTPPKVKSVKSATLERSGLGLGSYMVTEDYGANQGVSSKQSLSQLRNNRPRPASLGSGKEFSGTQGEVSQVGNASSNAPDLRRSLPAVQHSGDSQKLPRSQGISVLICPRAQNGDDRREALKRLGLLRD